MQINVQSVQYNKHFCGVLPEETVLEGIGLDVMHHTWDERFLRGFIPHGKEGVGENVMHLTGDIGCWKECNRSYMGHRVLEIM